MRLSQFVLISGAVPGETARRLPELHQCVAGLGGVPTHLGAFVIGGHHDVRDRRRHCVHRRFRAHDAIGGDVEEFDGDRVTIARA